MTTPLRASTVGTEAPAQESPLGRLDRLVKRVLTGQCVPFLGAGFSQGVTARDAEAPGPTLSAKEIAKEIARELLQHVQDDHGRGGGERGLGAALVESCLTRGTDPSCFRTLLGLESGCPRCDGGKCAHGTSLPDMNLGEIAELAFEVLGTEATVEHLRLPEWTHHSPTPAHRYLAMLVREGLVREVLETNYDTFVEDAVVETFGQEEGVAQGAALVIHDLSTYQRSMGEARAVWDSRAQVKVVKLNGCARSHANEMERAKKLEDLAGIEEQEPYTDTKRGEAAVQLPARPARGPGRRKASTILAEVEVRADRVHADPGAAQASPEPVGRSPDEAKRIRRGAAESIVLTEAQLQGWGRKRWARDCLADRLRTRSILFVGFGSQDPVVRHHALDVMREFGDERRGEDPGAVLDPEGGSSPGDGWHTFPNAPFVAAYEPTLSFYQLQILRAFRDAYGSRVETDGDRPSTASIDEIHRNAFVGLDARRMGISSQHAESDRLSADDLMGEIAVRAISRLARDGILSEESPLHSYLGAAVRMPGLLLGDVRETWFREDPVSRLSPFTAWLRLDANGTCPWSRACFGLRGGLPGPGAYRPFMESRIKQAMLLVLLHLADAGVSVRPGEAAERVVGPMGTVGNAISAFRLDPPGQPGPPVDSEHPRGVHQRFATSGTVSQPEQLRHMPDRAVLIQLGAGFEAARPWQVRVESGSQEWEVREVFSVGDLSAMTRWTTKGLHAREAKENLDLLSRAPLLFAEDPGRSWRQHCERTS